MKSRALVLLAIAAALSACATEPTWERIVPPSRMVNKADGCPAYTVDDAAPLSQWKKVGEFYDQDYCQGNPYEIAELRQRREQSKVWVRKKAAKGDPEAIEIVRCWDQKDYLSWTAPASSSLVAHDWNDSPFACIEKDDPRLAASTGAKGTPQVAGK